MCKSKCKGGLGFRSLYGFNIALLGKLVWQFMNKPSSLVARVCRARYYPTDHIQQAQRDIDASFICMGICEARDVLSKGFKWLLEDGQIINIFYDPWLKGKVDFKVENHHVNNSGSEKVSEYFRSDTK